MNCVVKIIQIQHLLKLNISYYLLWLAQKWIQIQHLLKLNGEMKWLMINKLDSNTTFVKVKFIQIIN